MTASAPLTVVASRDSSDPAADYAAAVLRVTASIVATGELPYVHGTAWRATSWGVMPVWCGACCIWSTFWRAAACPVMCMCKGAGFACSNNGCTDCTDACITDYVDAIGAREALRHAAPADASPQLLDAIAEVETHFMGVTAFTDRHATLASAVVGPVTWVPGASMMETTRRVPPGLAMDRLAAARARIAAALAPP